MGKRLKKNNNKIRICFFSPASYPFFEKSSAVVHGGAELQMYLLAKYLAENQVFEIIFLVGNYGQKEMSIQHNIHLLRTIQLKQKEDQFSKVLKAVKYFSQLIKLKPDIIISTNANALTGINAFYAKLFKKKFIYRTSHLIDVNCDYIKSEGLSGKLYKYGLINANKVITQNAEHQSLLKKNHDIEASVIKNLINVEEFTYSEKRGVLWVGRFQNWKRPELFLKLAENFPKKHFVMICPYSPLDKKMWEILKKSANEIPNITLIEKIPYFEIQDYFYKAELFVNTSDFEGFPNTFLQAAMGKTPIASLNVNPDNFITKYNCGIFSNGNFENMLIEIEHLLENAENRKLTGENLYRYIKENHDIEKNGQLFKIIIESII
jgi:glycosyltransferase involved in cell wall biosynthesis